MKRANESFVLSIKLAKSKKKKRSIMLSTGKDVEKSVFSSTIEGRIDRFNFWRVICNSIKMFHVYTPDP